MWNYSGGQQEPLKDLEQGSHTMKAGFQDQWTTREETEEDRHLSEGCCINPVVADYNRLSSLMYIDAWVPSPRDSDSIRLGRAWTLSFLKAPQVIRQSSLG